MNRDTRNGNRGPTWSRWTSFPDPRESQYLRAPIGSGVYEIRRRDTREFVLVGAGKCVAVRMGSLLPPPLGQGTRNNTEKRRYLLKHLGEIQYRCYPCKTREQAATMERKKQASTEYLFPT